MVKQYYNAYSAAVQTVAKTRQVVMLFDAAIRHLAKAKTAIEEHQIEERFNELSKAGEIVLGLQGCLDFDKGGDVAKLLYDFYSSIDARIFVIHRTSSSALCDSLIKELKMMREAWDEIDRNSGNGASEADASDAAATSGNNPPPPPQSMVFSA